VRPNPEHEHASRYAAAWAAELGLPVSPGHARSCADRHPAAGRRELAVVTCWHTWLSFVDHHFPDGCRGLPAGERKARRMATFMPVHGGPAAEPAGPAEAGLADLWARTVPGRSPAWRSRLAEAVTRLLMESLWRLVIGYRYPLRSPAWSAALIEYTTGAEVPAESVGLLNRRFADCVYLADEGAGQALEARLREFDSLTLVQLPALTGDERVLRYASGLRDWLRAGRRAAVPANPTFH